jgi:hypothetical protein
MGVGDRNTTSGGSRGYLSVNLTLNLRVSMGRGRCAREGTRWVSKAQDGYEHSSGFVRQGKGVWLAQDALKGVLGARRLLTV